MSLEEFLCKSSTEQDFFFYRGPQSQQLDFFYAGSKKNSSYKITWAPFDENTQMPLALSAQKKTFAIDAHKLDDSENRNPGIQPRNIQKLKDKHIDLVHKAINELDGKFKKVVLSSEFVFDLEIDQTKTYMQMLAIYKNAHVYWGKINGQEWMGASPELLLSVRDNHFDTVSLAGTQPWSDSVNWTKKEFEEQEYVTSYLCDCLERFGLRYEKAGPKTIKAGNLAHLKTNINGLLDDDRDTQSILNLIHPTPAVCGLPKNRALEFIRNNEGYNRSFYTGYIGIESSNTEVEDSSYFVNLRSMQVLQNQISIFVGGGITKDSLPEKEWEEIWNKSKVMASVLVPK